MENQQLQREVRAGMTAGTPDVTMQKLLAEESEVQGLTDQISLLQSFNHDKDFQILMLQNQVMESRAWRLLEGHL